MMLIDIYDMAGWWTLVVLIQVFIGSFYFLTAKRRPTRYYPLSNGQPIEWNPKPLVKHDVEVQEPPLMGKIDDHVLNVGATSFLSMDKEESVIESALKAMEKYGVGSCGPRGFYGTIDVHLELEERLAKFLQVEETCVYSYGFSTIASAIPAYAKRGDIIFADENVWFALQKGIDASRSKVCYFKHNDVDYLEELLFEAANEKELTSRRRAFLVIEAIYYNTGEMCPLKRMVELARKYKLRIILDESLSIGVLGENGRGITELLDIPRGEIDLMVGSLEHSFGSIGGFCAGSHYVVEHQRLSGLGYCFSASLPPMLTQAAITALDLLEKKPDMIDDLNDISKKLNQALAQLKHYTFRGHELSPIKHIYIKINMKTKLKERYLEYIVKYALEKGIAFAMPVYLKDVEHNCPEPSIRLAASKKLYDENIYLICSVLEEAYKEVCPEDSVFETAQ